MRVLSGSASPLVDLRANTRWQALTTCRWSGCVTRLFNVPMSSPRENQRMRWLALVAVWGFCALLIGLHTQAVQAYVDRLDAIGRRGADVTTPMRHVLPARYADAQVWVRHAIAAEAAGEARLRFTRDDNAPQGREVHWASPLLWLLRSASGATDIEDILLRFNAPLLFGFIVLFTVWVSRRAGTAAGVLIGLAMVGHNRFYDTFAPGNVDHHGLLTACVFGLSLGLVFMGAGWWKPNLGGTFSTLLPSDVPTARRGAIASAIFGAIGMWISAASVLPAIAIGCGAGLVLAIWRGRSAVRDGARFEPAVWRLWGRVGGGLSLLFYLIEYAPSHLQLRLEVNHPIYACTGWGGAEIVAAVGVLVVERHSAAGRLRAILRLIIPTLAVFAAPVAILLGGTRVFLISDPFVSELRHFVLEGKSLPEAVESFGIRIAGYFLVSSLLLLPAIGIGWRARGEGATLVGFATLVAAGFIALGFWEVRWWFVGSATQIVLLVVMVAMTRNPWLWVAVCAAGLLVPSGIERIASTRRLVRDGIVDERDILQPLYRDIAATLRASQPEGDITLLASPNASVGIGYYGSFKTIGTLFWENAPGLKAAAAIFSARSDDDAAALVRARGITHIAIVSTASFLSEYHRLLHPDAAVDAYKSAFGYRLAGKRPDVAWLQPIPYKRSPDLQLAKTHVALFKVAFDQTEMDRLYHTTLALAAGGDVTGAERSLEEALARIPADARFSFAEAVGAALYDFGADAAAVRALRRALALKPDPNVATTMAWILATTGDQGLRDGRGALQLIDPIAQRELDDPTVLSALAAALAEVGRFPDAVVIAERALGAVQAANDPAMTSLLQRRLDSYRASRAWRQ